MPINYRCVSFTKQLLVIIIMAHLFNQVSTICNVSKCSTCSSTNVCSTCDQWYNLTVSSCCNNITIQNCGNCQTNGNICQSCISNSYCLSNNTCGNCSSFMSQCATCSDCSTCLTCSSANFTINANNQCQLCQSFMDYCYECSNNNTCTKCFNTSFAVNSTSNRCQLCGTFLDNCDQCVSDITCIACVISPNIVFLGGKCTRCSDVIPRCLNCTKYDNCTICSQYFALEQINDTVICTACPSLMFGCLDCSSTTNCTTCSIGLVVRYGCSSVPGCVSVTQNETSAICDYCDSPQFQPIPINGTCLCMLGHLAGRYCTQIAGCTSVIRNGTLQTCIACNLIQYFVLNGSKCNCRQYYEKQGQKCGQICGDGILYVLPCDDGNTVDRDGCSSTCKIEKGYICKRGLNHGISTCTYDGVVSLSLQSINNLGGNTASIVFQLSTPISNFAKSNLTDLISFGAVNGCQMTNYSATGSSLSVFIQFEVNVENTNANITLQFDSNYINSPKTSLQFKIVQTNGDSLLYDPDYYDGSNEIITMPIKFISGLLWASLFFASYSHKMIGVETMHTIQLMLFLQACSQKYLPVVVDFEDLSIALNAYQNFFIKQTLISSKRRLTRIGYSGDFLANISVVAIIQFSSILLYLLLVIVQKVYLPFTKSKFRKIVSQKLPILRNILYRVMVFPIIIGTYFHYILSLMIHSNISIPKIDSDRFLQGMTALGLTFSTFIVFFGECKPQAKRIEQQTPSDMKANYVKFYLLGVFIISIFIYMALIDDSSKPLVYVLAAAEVLISITLLFYRPYKNWVHTIGLILNFCGISLNIGWIVSQEYFSLTRQQEEIIAFAQIGMITFIIIWAIIRTVYELKKANAKEKVPQKKTSPNKKKQNKENKFQFNRNEFVRAILRENESHMRNYCINSQLLQKGYENSQNSNLKKEDKRVGKQSKDLQRRKLLKSALINEYMIQEEQDRA